MGFDFLSLFFLFIFPGWMWPYFIYSFFFFRHAGRPLKNSLATNIFYLSIAAIALWATVYPILYFIMVDGPPMPHWWVGLSIGAAFTAGAVLGLCIKSLHAVIWHAALHSVALAVLWTPILWPPAAFGWRTGSIVAGVVPAWLIWHVGTGMALFRWSKEVKRRHIGHCVNCAYDLTGLPAGAAVCPECGRAFAAGSTQK